MASHTALKRSLKGRLQKPSDEFTAAALGELPWLEACLGELGRKVTYDSNGLAPIHLSALHGRLDCLKLLIEKQKVNVNLPSTTGWRPIHLCVSNQTGDRAIKCLNYLLNHGADPSVTNEDDVTPVHQAASEGHIQCLKVLIENGAVLDMTDKRGHTPMDLAKLWGHRKCARILASERWHQDKSGIASDMAQLRKDRMEQVLRDLEQEERNQNDSSFFGQLAFSDWLDKHGLPPDATEPTNAKNRLKKSKNDGKKSSAKGDRRAESSSGEKPNSVSKKASIDASGYSNKRKKLAANQKPVIDSKAKTIEVQKDDVSSETPKIDTLQTVNDVEEVSEVAPPDGEMRNWELFENPDRWNTSCKVGETFNDYLPRLNDAYPRDLFTMLPTKGATPYELNVRHPKIFVTDNQERVKRADEVLNVRERLSQVNMSFEMLPDENEALRPALYRCNAVQDLPKRKPVHDLPTKMVCEGGMHLTDDVKSPIFKAGLVIEPLMTDGSSNTSIGNVVTSQEHGEAT